MTTKSASDIRTDIQQGYQSYMSELQLAGPVWERKPAAGDGEDAWCARQVAEHIAGAGLFFGAGIADAIGVQGPALARIELPTAADAVTRTSETHGMFITVADQVRDDQLSMEIDHPRLGKQTLGGIMGIVAYHFNDHAQQLRTLREA